jgi:hypothetical protein
VLRYARGLSVLKVLSVTPIRWFLISLALVTTAAGTFTWLRLEAREASTPCTAAPACPPDEEPRSAEETARAKAMHTYRLALARSLARSDDPDALLAAADSVTWAEVDADAPPTPPELAPAVLLARATRAAPDDARIWFAASANGCEPEEAHCAADDARTRLLVLDADNAAAWLLEFTREQRRGNAAQARAALARAARAPAFRDYGDALRRAVLRETLADPTEYVGVPGDLPSGWTPAVMARAVKLNNAYVAYFTGPVNEFVVRACNPAIGAAHDEVLQADCRAIGAAMVVEDAGMTSQTLGLVIQARLANDPSQRESLERRKRDLDWMRHLEIVTPGLNPHDAAAIEREIEARLSPMGEVAWLRKRIVDAGLSPTAPEGWEPVP